MNLINLLNHRAELSTQPSEALPLCVLLFQVRLKFMSMYITNAELTSVCIALAAEIQLSLYYISQNKRQESKSGKLRSC